MTLFFSVIEFEFWVLVAEGVHFDVWKLAVRAVSFLDIFGLLLFQPLLELALAGIS